MASSSLARSFASVRALQTAKPTFLRQSARRTFITSAWPLAQRTARRQHSLKRRTDSPSLLAHTRFFSTTRARTQDAAPPGSTFKSTSDVPSPASSSASSTSSPSTPISSSSTPEQFQNTPHYHLTFTCKPCSHRSSHYISHHGYKTGTVLITCPSCKARHLIADHLKIFSDKSRTLEDILKDTSGEVVVKGRVAQAEEGLGEMGDIEFWRNEEKITEGAETQQQETSQEQKLLG